MRAVILAGGLGTRLRPYTTIIPKPLVPVGDRPILEHIMGRLAGCGVTKIDLCVSHLGELIQLYFSQEGMVPPEVELDWHWEDEPQGTAGALRSVPGLDETFIAMNGDILTSLDYRELVAFHREQGATLTIATHAKAGASRPAARVAFARRPVTWGRRGCQAVANAAAGTVAAAASHSGVISRK